jgi:hypothetical protein
MVENTEKPSACGGCARTLPMIIGYLSVAGLGIHPSALYELQGTVPYNFLTALKTPEAEIWKGGIIVRKY